MEDDSPAIIERASPRIVRAPAICKIKSENVNDREKVNILIQD